MTSVELLDMRSSRPGFALAGFEIGSQESRGVTHTFFPSANPFLFEVEARITNISGQNLGDVRYARMIDYDVPPNTFSEYITHAGTAASPTLVSAVDRALGSTANPLAAPPAPAVPGGVGDFVDLGPADQGSRMVFALGPLAPNASTSVRMFYGAAFTEGQALHLDLPLSGAVQPAEGPVPPRAPAAE